MDENDATGAGVAPTRSPPVTLPEKVSGLATPGLFTGLLPSSGCLVRAHAAVALADWALVYDLVHLSGDVAPELYDASEHIDLLEVSLPTYGDTSKLPAGDVASSDHGKESNEAP